MTTTIEGSVALVTGANRGLGAAFCRQLRDQGAAKVYAGARNPSTVTIDGVVPVELDVTDPAHVQAAADRCRDVDLLVNNAGISGGPTLSDDSLEVAQQVFDARVSHRTGRQRRAGISNPRARSTP